LDLSRACLVSLLAALATQALGEERVADGPTFALGAELEPHLPPEIWAHRALFFEPETRIEIGPPQRDYSPPAAFGGASEGARLGPDGSLLGHVAGQPFDDPGASCDRDPAAGFKIVWNVEHRWRGAGEHAHFRISWWDRGERVGAALEGREKSVAFAHRLDLARFTEREAANFRRDPREWGLYAVVDHPAEARGTSLWCYRYRSAEGVHPLRPDDCWVYAPALRRVRRSQRRSHARALPAFPQPLATRRGFGEPAAGYRWQCLAGRALLVPVDRAGRGYPQDPAADFGASGLSFAPGGLEMRETVRVRGIPRDPAHPYTRWELVVDRQTSRVVYGFVWDDLGELSRIHWHAAVWSEDDPGRHPGWPGIERPRDWRPVVDVLVNPQAFAGSRVEFYDDRGAPFSTFRAERGLVDPGCLSKPCRFREFIDPRETPAPP